jgi:iron complex transport system substrate-binding protein
MMKLCLLLALVWLCSLTVAADINVVDFEGREVSLSAPAKRIIALAPNIVENLFSAGAGDKLVGVVDYSNFPAAAQQIERVGNYKTWSLESIVALKPDLVLMWSSGNGIDALHSLERLGIPVFASEVRQLADIPKAIRTYGVLAGTEGHSEREAARIEQALSALNSRYAQQQPVSVFYQVWDEPLQTLNGDHFISRVIELCGGVNAFADAPHLAPRINIEAVLERDPQVIIASGMGEARPDWLDQWHAYPSLTAVQQQALFFVPPDYIQRPTSRVLLGAAQLCDQLATVRSKSTPD